ncbi:MAG: hypothetical protein ABI441_03770 [Flavobacterium sp.]
MADNIEYSDDKVLIKIHRQFTEHESIQFLIRRLKESILKAEQQQSYLYELQYKVEKLRENVKGLERKIASLKNK